MLKDNVRFIRYRHYDRKGKIKADFGWRLQLWRFFIRLNKQMNYVAFEFGRKNYKIVDPFLRPDDAGDGGAPQRGRSGVPK